MNEVAKSGGGELTEAEKQAFAEKFKAERAAQQARLKAEKALADGKVVPIESVKRAVPKIVEMSRAAREAYHAEKVVEELAQSAGAKLGTKEESKTGDFTSKEAPKEEPKADPDEENDPRPATSELNSDEVRKRRLIRAMKLKEINDKYAVVRSYGGKCEVFEFQPKEAFDQWMANEFIPSLKKQKGEDAVAPWWFRHPRRKEYDGVIFKPLAEQVITTSGHLKILNMYLGWGVEPKQGDWSLIRQHIMEVLANGDSKAGNYIMNWNAWGVQHPDLLPEVALTLIGEKGTGKGTLSRVLRMIFGSHSIQVSNIRHLTGTFNAYKENLIFLVADEAYWGGHKGEAGELQRMITEDTLFIEPKYFNQYEAKNYIHSLILAEPGWVIPAGRNERRYAVFHVGERYLGDRKYFKALHHQIDNGGAAAMLYDLQQMNLGDWHPREIYKTAALGHQQELSLSPLDEWMLGLLEDGELPGTQPGRPRTANPTTLLNDAHVKVPRARDIGKMKLADYLNNQWQCFSHGGTERGYNFPPLAEMRSTWEKRFGPRKWSPIGDWGFCPQPPLNMNEKL
jgi:hypothetical protein